MAIDGVDSAVVREKLAQKKINVGLSPPSSTLLDAERRQLPPLVRLSPHYYNSEEEIETACQEVGRITRAGA
jgi:selenocysteine lyase/cysteine desulfurase